jgi:hypothetical protein
VGFGQFLPKPLGIDPVKPEDSDLCGNDPVSDVEPSCGVKDSPKRLLPISKRPALVIRPLWLRSDIISLLLNRHNIFLRICQMQIKKCYVYRTFPV